MEFHLKNEPPKDEKPIHFAEKRRLSNFERIQRRFRVFITVAFAAVACSIAIIAFKSRIVAPTVKVHFDPSMLTRISDVSRVYALREDPQNKRKLWFGSAEGLFAYNRDDLSIMRYGTDYGLPSEYVFDLCFTTNAVWAGSGWGPAILYKGTTRFKPIFPHDSVSVLSVEAINDTEVVLFSPKRGLLRLSEKNITSPEEIKIEGLKWNREITCLRSIDKQLYIGTDMQEVFVYDPVRRSSRQYKFNANKDGGGQILDIMKYDSSLYVATSIDGLYRSVGTDSLDKVRAFPTKGVFVLQPEPDGFWAGTPWGLWRYHKKEDVWVQFINPDERKPGDFQVIALYSDSSELWYGTSQTGMGHFNKQKVEWISLHAGMTTPNVASLACMDSSLFASFGYKGGYIDKFNKSTMQFDLNINWSYGLSDPTIQTLSVQDKKLYFGGYESFGYFDFSTGRMQNFTKGKPLQAYDITQILPVDSSCLLGTVFGIVRFYPSLDRFIEYTTTLSDRITCMYRDGDSLWYGTLGRGVKMLSISKGRVSASKLTSPNRIVGITSFNKAGHKKLFIATDRSGCYLMDTAGAITKMTIDKAFLAGENPSASENELRCMAVSDSLIWLGTDDAGCLVYDPSNNKWGSFTFFEGLLSNQVRSIYDTPDYLYIGCYGGLHKLKKSHPGVHNAIFGVNK